MLLSWHFVIAAAGGDIIMTNLGSLLRILGKSSSALLTCVDSCFQVYFKNASCSN